MERMTNPFEYSSPLEPGDLLDRDDEAQRLLARAEGGHNSRVVAPRRYGKTSLLLRVLQEAEAEGWAGVYVNFFGALTPAEIAERVERSYAERLRGGLGAWFEGVRRALRPTVRAGGGPLPVSAEVSVEASQPSLLERLALPKRLFDSRGVRSLVVFDEFQDLLAAGERLDAVIRSEVERHGEAASYVFAGSHLGMMRELFTDKRRAFYGQAGAVDLGPLSPEDVASYVESRFTDGGKRIGAALGPLLDLAGGHPQRTMLLAHWLWEATPPGEEADEQHWAQACEVVLQREVCDELRALWTSFTPTQRRIVSLIADQQVALYGVDAQARYGLSRGGTVTKAIRSLIDAGDVVEKPGAVSRHRLVDPLFAAWVRAR
jgi:hypothetical protein